MTTPLARRYRRLLLCYPRTHRRDELLATLLDAAPPDRTRPTLREASDLLRHGLRARLGRPASRTVVAWATLATVISGLFGAAFATRAAWETVRPLPDAAQTRAMLLEILPNEPWDQVYPPPPATFAIYNQPLGWNMASEMMLGDGGEYSQAAIGAGVNGHPGDDPRRTVDEALANLESHGWRVYNTAWSDAYSCVGPPCDPTTIPQNATIAARRGDTALTLEVYTWSTPDTTHLSASFMRTTPLAVWPAGIAGFLLASLAALLLFGWASRRTEADYPTRPAATSSEHPARGWVMGLFGLAMVLWWAPTLYALPFMTLHHVREPHPTWHPMWEWLGQPTFSLFFVVGGGCLLLALALSALPRRQTEAITAAT
ncbi:MAG TPA: hypothetical protein VL738_25000 [Dactylosporangium sp.]|nr:hypothetical protein [Dactylosporangium sp.]